MTINLSEDIVKELRSLGEEVSRDAVNSIFKIIEAYVKNSETKMDDVLLPFLPNAKEFVLKFVDKIDGEETK